MGWFVLGCIVGYFVGIHIGRLPEEEEEDAR
jgi:hypothetical protein